MKWGKLISALIIFIILLVVSFYYFNGRKLSLITTGFLVILYLCMDEDGGITSVVSYTQAYSEIPQDERSKFGLRHVSQILFHNSKALTTKSGERGVIRTENIHGKITWIGLDLRSNYKTAKENKRQSRLIGVWDGSLDETQALSKLCPEPSKMKEDIAAESLANTFGTSVQKIKSALWKEKEKEESLREMVGEDNE